MHLFFWSNTPTKQKIWVPTISHGKNNPMYPVIVKNILSQILAFVSKVHQVILPEDAVDYETVTMEQVSASLLSPTPTLPG
jgi:hypothetical protein